MFLARFPFFSGPIMWTWMLFEQRLDTYVFVVYCVVLSGSLCTTNEYPDKNFKVKCSCSSGLGLNPFQSVLITFSLLLWCNYVNMKVVGEKVRHSDCCGLLCGLKRFITLNKWISWQELHIQMFKFILFGIKSISKLS